jgi:hypothetical protein
VRALLALGLFALGLGASVGTTGCGATSDDDEGQTAAAVSATEGFDRDDLLSDAALRDAKALTAAEVQAFLEKTPFKKRAGLADYEEGGKSAAEILHDAAERNGINPLALLVRAHMEQGLLSDTNPTSAKIAKTFGCGCPDGSACATKYAGLARQAECAAGTLRRALDGASGANGAKGTVSGWARGKTKSSLDHLDVTPKNAATAALYTYTPWVGQRGGGKAGVGGASLHVALWTRFADHVDYKTPTDTETMEIPGQDAPSIPGTGTAPADGPPADGSEDKDLTGTSNAPATRDVPPASKRSSSSSASAKDDPPEEVSYAAACTAAPHGPRGGGSDTAPRLAAFALVAAAMVLARRRRTSA